MIQVGVRLRQLEGRQTIIPRRCITYMFAADVLSGARFSPSVEPYVPTVYHAAIHLLHRALRGVHRP